MTGYTLLVNWKCRRGDNGKCRRRNAGLGQSECARRLNARRDLRPRGKPVDTVERIMCYDSSVRLATGQWNWGDGWVFLPECRFSFRRPITLTETGAGHAHS